MKNNILFFFTLLLISFTLLAIGVPPLEDSSSSIAMTSTKARPMLKGQNQKQKRIIDEAVTYADSPIEITDIQVKGKMALLNKQIDNDDKEWFRDLSFRIKNNSNKEIAFINLYLVLPQTKDSGLIINYPMSFGSDPKFPKGPEKTKRLKTGDSADFILSEEKYNTIQKHLEKRGHLQDITHLRVSIQMIIFDDDTAWSMGEWFRRNPDNPKQWIPVE